MEISLINIGLAFSIGLFIFSVYKTITHFYEWIQESIKINKEYELSKKEVDIKEAEAEVAMNEWCESLLKLFRLCIGNHFGPFTYEKSPKISGKLQKVTIHCKCCGSKWKVIDRAAPLMNKFILIVDKDNPIKICGKLDENN